MKTQKNKTETVINTDNILMVSRLEGCGRVGEKGVGVFLCLSVCTKGVADRGSAVCLDMDLLYTLGQGCVSVYVCELGRG